MINSYIPESFKQMLERINEYYLRHPSYAVSEDLIEYEGPQDEHDMYNKFKLHSYGRGLTKYYSMRVLKEEILNNYGKDVLEKFENDHQTTAISRQEFNCLLQQVHNRISKGNSRYRKKHKPYYGPQCNEQRWSYPYRVNYDIK